MQKVKRNLIRISNKYNLDNEISKKYYKKFLFDIILLYIILLWESISNKILIDNNFLGVVYKDFNCNNWTNYLSNISPKIEKKCPKNSYFLKDNITINYPNLWVYNNKNSLEKFKKRKNKEYSDQHYCKEFLETEKLVSKDISKYQSYSPIVNIFYENEKDDVRSDKHYNNVLVTQMKMYIKNKTEVNRCIPDKYIFNESIIFNRIGTSIGYVNCELEVEGYSSEGIISSNLKSNEVTFDFGFKVPDTKGVYVFINIISYPIYYVSIYGFLSFFLLNLCMREYHQLLNKIKLELRFKNYESLKMLLLKLKKYNLKLLKRKIKFCRLLTKAIIGFIFYYQDIVNLNICDLTDNKLECYINKFTINSYLGFSSLRPEECYNRNFFSGSLYFHELLNTVLVGSFFFSAIFLLISFLFDCKIPGNIFIIYVVQFVTLGLTFNTYYNLIVILILVLTGFFIFLLAFPVILLFDIANIYFFFKVLFISEYWGMLQFKTPNFNGLNLELGFMYNKNIILLIKIIIYTIIILTDLVSDFDNKSHEYLINKFNKELNKLKNKELDKIKIEI